MEARGFLNDCVVLFCFSAEKENTFRGIERVCMLKQSPLLFCFHFFYCCWLLARPAASTVPSTSRSACTCVRTSIHRRVEIGWTEKGGIETAITVKAGRNEDAARPRVSCFSSENVHSHNQVFFFSFPKTPYVIPNVGTIADGFELDSFWAAIDWHVYANTTSGGQRPPFLPFYVCRSDSFFFFFLICSTDGKWRKGKTSIFCFLSFGFIFRLPTRQSTKCESNLKNSGDGRSKRRMTKKKWVDGLSFWIN